MLIERALELRNAPLPVPPVDAPQVARPVSPLVPAIATVGATIAAAATPVPTPTKPPMVANQVQAGRTELLDLPASPVPGAVADPSVGTKRRGNVKRDLLALSGGALVGAVATTFAIKALYKRKGRDERPRPEHVALGAVGVGVAAVLLARVLVK